MVHATFVRYHVCLRIIKVMTPTLEPSCCRTHISEFMLRDESHHSVFMRQITQYACIDSHTCGLILSLMLMSNSNSLQTENLFGNVCGHYFSLIIRLIFALFNQIPCDNFNGLCIYVISPRAYQLLSSANGNVILPLNYWHSLHST